MNFGTLTQSSELSFVSNTGSDVVFTLSHLPDRLIITISELQKVGHIIDVFFPRVYTELGHIAYHRPDFDSKVVFGPDTGTYDFFISRLAACLCRLHLDNKPVRLFLGLDRLNDEIFLQEILDNFEQRARQ